MRCGELVTHKWANRSGGLIENFLVPQLLISLFFARVPSVTSHEDSLLIVRSPLIVVVSFHFYSFMRADSVLLQKHTAAVN